MTDGPDTQRVMAAGTLFALGGGLMALYGILVPDQVALAGRAIVAWIALFLVFGAVAVHRAGDGR